MRHNFDRAFDFVVGHEGGYSADRRDRGNWTTGQVGKGELKGTKFGISAMSYPDLDIKNLAVADAKEIYFNDYWAKAHCDDLPDGIDYLVFDASVNHGVGQAIKFLQIAAGATADGVLGPQTKAAVEKRDPLRLIEEFAAQRQLFWNVLKTFKFYGHGWTRRGYGSVVRAMLIRKNIDEGPVLDQSKETSPNESLLFGLFRRV